MKHFFKSIALLALLATATTGKLQAQTTTTGQVFEMAGYVDAATFVPAAQMNGALHSVAPQAWNNGLQNTYQLSSGGQTVMVTGTPLLIQRINEIYALDYLNNLSKTQEFTSAMAKSLGQKVDSVVGIVKDPVGTLQNLPKGASRFFGGIGEALKGGKSDTEGSALGKLVGVNKVKAKLAVQLGVSPYTDNQALQDQLTSTARAMAGGGLVVNFATSAVTGGVGTVIGVNQTMQDALVNTSADDMRIINRKKLFALGLSRDDADAFLMHPNYTPWQNTIIVDALARIGANPKTFLAEACTASNAVDAFYFQRLAQLLLQYHKNAASIKSIRMVGGLVCGLDKAGTLVIPVSLDYAIWSDRVAARTDQFAALMTGSKDIKALALWTDGQLSTRLCDELNKRSVSWKMLALDVTKTTPAK